MRRRQRLDSTTSGRGGNKRLHRFLGFALLLVGAVAVAVVSSSGRGEAAVPSAGLVGYWSFDEGSGNVAADGSGRGHDGSLTYGPAWVSSCVAGGCISFDGSDDYVRIPDAPDLQLVGDMTLSAWIRPAALGTAQSVVSKRYEFELGWIDSASPYATKWSHKDSAGSVVSGNLTSSTNAGQWQHLTLVRSGNVVRGYRDGFLVSSSSFSSGPGSSNHNVNIGRNPGGAQRFSGLIDEVRIYDRALTDAEVRELDGAPGDPPPPDTQAPTQPTGLRATTASASRIDLNWTGSTDDTGVVGYRVYRDGVQVATPTGTSYGDNGLAPSTTYAYAVAAVDAAGNPSSQSEPESASTFAAPPQREDVTLATGFVSPTSMAVAPDGRIFVAEQGGALRVVKNGTLLAAPFLTVPVVSTNERGLLGVEFDPAFTQNGYVYIYYTANTSPVVNRLSRFTASAANPDRADSASERILLGDIPSQTGWHNGGGIHFGPDGRIYVAVGEGHHEDNAQSLGILSGKLLRLNPDGSIPTDNPFYGSASGENRAIWALGLRNPFTFDVEWATGRIFVNDVGENAWEEVNEAWSGPNTGSNAGFNFGWPATEGPTADPRYRTPFHAYPQANGDCAITGGAFYDPATVNFPSEYAGDYFFADYCSGWIKSIDLGTKAVTTFLAADGTRDPVDLKVTPDGSLLYLARANNGTASLHRVRYLTSNQPPTIVIQPADRTTTVGGSATFTVSASGSSPLQYQWQRNGVDIAGATASSYSLSNAQLADSGSRFRVVVRNAFGTATSAEAVLTVTSNSPPVASITAPAVGQLYAGGDSITYGGSGTDAEDGGLPPSAFTWKIDFHHEDHLHPFMPATAGATGGSFTVPVIGEVSADVWFRIHLTVRDSDGATHSVFRDVRPRTVNVSLATEPPGLQLLLDGQPVVTPHTFTGVVGIQRSLEAPSPQTAGDTSYAFSAWSDGGARSHTISTPAAATTYTARFTSGAPPPVPAQGLVGYWPFEEGIGSTTADASGNGRTGVLTYHPTWTSGCIVGRCLSFDGVDDYVKVADSAALRLTGDVTIAAWIRVASLAAKQSIVSKRYEFELGWIEPTPPNPIKWSQKNPGGKLVFGDLVSSTEAGSWQHVALVRDGAARTVTGYWNGSLVSVSAYAVAPGTSSYALNIGRNPGGVQRFKGLIDEVRIYNQALGGAEIAALAAQG